MPSLPDSAGIQFLPATGKLYVDNLIDPSGAPLTVLDIDAGFTVNGHLELPGWFVGKGVVRFLADELGGQIDKEIGHADVQITGSTMPNDPPSKVYPWSITVRYPTLPDESKMYRLGLVFILQTPGGGHTDIGGFYDLGAFLVV